MIPRARLLPIALVAAMAMAAPVFAQCPLPDPTRSFFVPQAGSIITPSEGFSAYRFFRVCPNNDGGTSLPNNARIRIVLNDNTGTPMAGVPADQIYMLFNGGTAVQGFTGTGADSIIANGTYNVSPACPDVREIYADGPTDVNGVTFITFTGASGTPGVGLRNALRKWGHWDQEIPVYVGHPPCNPVQIKGQLTTPDPTPGDYVLRIKNVDAAGGLGTALNQGEVVTIIDYNVCFACLTVPTGFYCYWVDFDWSGIVTAVDLNILFAHMTHDCDTPLSP